MKEEYIKENHFQNPSYKINKVWKLNLDNNKVELLQKKILQKKAYPINKI